jgi:AraC-like DNA-binding protein
MISHTRVPQPPLSDFVALLWLYDGWSPSHARERALPDGSVELVVNLLEDETRLYDADDFGAVRRFSGTVLCGPHSRYFVIDTAEQVRAAGVHFKPGGAFPFLPPPMHELTDTHLSLEDLWGRAARELRERMLEAPTPEGKLDALEAALLARLARARPAHPAVAYALRRFRERPHAHTVARVRDEIGISPRRFIEVFKQEAGLTPKLFCRVRRFQRVVRRIYRRERIVWADVALACGYYDQAHFIHDFRAFSGLNPTAYLAQAGRHPNHVPIAG